MWAVLWRIAEGSCGEAIGLGRESLSNDALPVYAPVAEHKVASDIVVLRRGSTEQAEELLCCKAQVLMGGLEGRRTMGTWGGLTLSEVLIYT